jgi:predicted dithiol-disulfide oxidoreductase (DUF899 family)
MQTRIVNQDEWLAARRELLIKEKALTRARDALSAERRKLPMVRVDRPYVFDTPGGPRTLAELFDGRSQLVVYHFMMGPEWKEGCPSCSMLADHLDGSRLHLLQRDVTLVVVSRAPLSKIDAFKQRMGWKFPWVSSYASDFNRDYHVSFTPDEVASGKMYYNFQDGFFPSDEAPGVSVFFRNADGEVFHTYSTYARGAETLLGVYNLLDLVPKGRDEDGLAFTMAWVRHHDRYPAESAATAIEPHACCDSQQRV